MWAAEVMAIDQPSSLEAKSALSHLIVHDEPISLSLPPMLNEKGEEEALSEHFGSVLVVNFWATWCAPCRREMPSLHRLQEKFSPNDVKIIAIAVGRHKQEKIQSFLASIGAEGMMIRLDPKLQVSAALRVRGLPATLLLDRRGREMARLIGEAEWDTDEVVEWLSEMAQLK